MKKAALPKSPVHDEKAASLADAGVLAASDVRLVHTRGTVETTCYFPVGTDLWAVLKRCDEWVKSRHNRH